jgi:hypothetical protein
MSLIERKPVTGERFWDDPEPTPYELAEPFNALRDLRLELADAEQQLRGAVSDPDALALALHHVFEGWVCHLPADDPDWRKYADEVLAHLGGQ